MQFGGSSVEDRTIEEAARSIPPSRTIENYKYAFLSLSPPLPLSFSGPERILQANEYRSAPSAGESKDLSAPLLHAIK